MKKSLKTILVAALFAGATVTAYAQAAGTTGTQTPPPTKGGAKQGKQGRTAKADPMLMLKRDTEVLEKLSLTDEQKSGVKKLKSETEAKLKELMKGKTKGDDRGAMRTKVKEAVEAYKKGLEGILTPVQYADYEKGMKALTKKAKDKKDGGSN